MKISRMASVESLKVCPLVCFFFNAFTRRLSFKAVPTPPPGGGCLGTHTNPQFSDPRGSPPRGKVGTHIQRRRRRKKIKAFLCDFFPEKCPKATPQGGGACLGTHMNPPEGGSVKDSPDEIDCFL